MRLRRRRKTADPESTKALAEAHESLKRVQDRTLEVIVVSNSLRSLREQNHFAAKFATILEGVRNA